VLSGDVHWGEISRRDFAAGYDLYDFTSSGINESCDCLEPNAYRVGEAVMEYNVGFMEIDWPARGVTVSLYDHTGAQRESVNLAFEEFSF
jgi:alkaline phosphatase D